MSTGHIEPWLRDGHLYPNLLDEETIMRTLAAEDDEQKYRLAAEHIVARGDSFGMELVFNEWVRAFEPTWSAHEALIRRDLLLAIGEVIGDEPHPFSFDIGRTRKS